MPKNPSTFFLEEIWGLFLSSELIRGYLNAKKNLKTSYNYIPISAEYKTSGIELIRATTRRNSTQASPAIYQSKTTSD